MTPEPVCSAFALEGGMRLECLRPRGHDGPHGWDAYRMDIAEWYAKVLRGIEPLGEIDRPQIRKSTISKPETKQPRQAELEEEVPIIATAGSGTNYRAAEAGIYNAVCVDVVDLGEEPNKFYDPNDSKSKKTIHKVRLIWELDEENPDTKSRFTVAQKFTLSINKKSKLRPFLVPWRGRDFTEEEEAGFDVEKLVGVPCTVTVINNAGDDGAIYANVSAVAPAQKKAERLSPSAGYVRVKDRPPKEQAAAMADPNKDEVPF